MHLVNTRADRGTNAPDREHRSPANRSTVELRGYMRKAEAAAFLGVTVRHVSNLMHRRAIPYYKLGRRLVLFRQADLERAIGRFRVEAVGDGA